MLEQAECLAADTHEPRGSFDLRDIDLGALKNEMRSGYRHIKAEQMRQILAERIRHMIGVNPRRIGYMEKLQRAVDRYNEGSANLVSDPPLLDSGQKITTHPGIQAEQERIQNEYSAALVEQVGEVTQEAQRAAHEGVSEHELALYDLLTYDLSLNIEEQSQFKQIARAILATLCPLFAIPDWQKKPQAYNQVHVCIEDELNTLPQTYSKEFLDEKGDALFLYIQQQFAQGGDSSVA